MPLRLEKVRLKSSRMNAKIKLKENKYKFRKCPDCYRTNRKTPNNKISYAVEHIHPAIFQASHTAVTFITIRRSHFLAFASFVYYFIYQYMDSYIEVIYVSSSGVKVMFVIGYSYIKSTSI